MPETYTSTWKHSAYHWSCKRDVRPCAVGSASKRLKPAKAYVAPAVVYAFGGDNQKASKHSLCDSYAQATRQDSSHRRRFLLHRQAALRQQNEAALEQACVWDYIIFFKVKDGVEEDTAQKMLDDFWSLQYLVPGGAVNAFAGNLRSAHLQHLSHELTHALHLRFSTHQQLEAFRQDQKLQAARELANVDLCSDMAEVAIQSFVLNELESIFRRGADWESGFDLILLLKAKDDVQDGEMKGFLDALAQISAGPGMQSLQSTHAHVQLLSGQLSGSHMLFTRFQSEQQLHTFLHSPPCVALQEQDARLPAQPVHSYVLSIGPPEANRSRAADAGGVLGVSNM